MDPRESFKQLDFKQLDEEMRGALGDVLQAQTKLAEARDRYRAALDKIMRLIDEPDPGRSVPMPGVHTATRRGSADHASFTSRVNDVVASSPSEIHTGESVAKALGLKGTAGDRKRARKALQRLRARGLIRKVRKGQYQAKAG